MHANRSQQAIRITAQHRWAALALKYLSPNLALTAPRKGSSENLRWEPVGSFYVVGYEIPSREWLRLYSAFEPLANLV